MKSTKGVGAASVDLTILEGLLGVLGGPRSGLASGLSQLTARLVGHSALVILAEHDAGQPRKGVGEQEVLSALTRPALEAIRENLTTQTPTRLSIDVAGKSSAIVAMVADTGALLVLAEPSRQDADDVLLALWQIIALRIQQDAHQASPAYLLESRVGSSLRAEAVAELADEHSTALESLLSVLRSTSLDDHAARRTAVDLATEAAVRLRTATDRVRTADEEPVTQAFSRLRSDLVPLLRYRDVDVQFVEPPVDGRPLPSEVAHGARAVVRGAIHALVDQPEVSRIRIQWDCDGKNLLIDLRDDGTSGLRADNTQVKQLSQRIAALRGSLTIATTEGWGSEMSVRLPLDPPSVQVGDLVPWGLAPRELEVLTLMADGLRNRAIAQELGISENTVKFHASKIFRKLGITSRSQVAAKLMQRQAVARTSSLLG